MTRRVREAGLQRERPAASPQGFSFGVNKERPIQPRARTVRTSYARYHVLAFLCAAAVIAYVQRLGFNVAEVAVRADLDLDKKQIGRVMAAWSLGYALLQLPSGWL